MARISTNVTKMKIPFEQNESLTIIYMLTMIIEV